VKEERGDFANRQAVCQVQAQERSLSFISEMDGQADGAVKTKLESRCLGPTDAPDRVVWIEESGRSRILKEVYVKLRPDLQLKSAIHRADDPADVRREIEVDPLVCLILEDDVARNPLGTARSRTAGRRTEDCGRRMRFCFYIGPGGWIAGWWCYGSIRSSLT
jgi:hypothetical protein